MLPYPHARQPKKCAPPEAERKVSCRTQQRGALRQHYQGITLPRLAIMHPLPAHERRDRH